MSIKYLFININASGFFEYDNISYNPDSFINSLCGFIPLYFLLISNLLNVVLLFFDIFILVIAFS
jgi:hypothetical protein